MSARNESALRFLDEECERLRDPERASQMERYFKRAHPFYGIGSPALRTMVKRVQSEHGASWTAASLLATSEALLEDTHGEKKLLGGYLLGVPANLRMIGDEPRVVDALGGFVERHVRDWATCDTLSSQVVRKLIARRPELAADVREWCTSSNDWKQRASCVSFVCLARHGEHDDVILDIAHHVVRNGNRFPQLGVGWVLRELSLSDEPAVVAFIKENYAHFTREGLRYAIEKMDKSRRAEMLNYRKR